LEELPVCMRQADHLSTPMDVTMRRLALALALSLALCDVSTAAARPMSALATAKPNIVLALVDDLGWNYPGYHNPEVNTPTLDRLAKQGVRLESHYTYKYCSPTRAAILIGRYPYHLANTRCNFIPSSIPEGVDLGYSMLPLHLATQGYVSHAVGKWHQGFHTAEYTPVGRGFNTSYGFLQGGEDHWTHWCGASAADCGIAGGASWSKNGAWDMWLQTGANFPGEPVLGVNGTVGDEATYSGTLFTHRVVNIVHAAADAGANAPPFFVYWAIHNTHAPIPGA